MNKRINNCLAISFILMIAISSLAQAQVSVVLTPLNPPIQIPNTGGSFEFNIAVSNDTTTAQTFDVWCLVTLPNGSPHGPVLGPVNITMPAGASNNRDRTQNVYKGAPGGNYIYEAYAGIYPDDIWSSDSFYFEKFVPPDTLWTQISGGSSFDSGYSVQQTADGGYIIAGETSSYGAGGYDVYLIKTDAAGDTSWTQTFGGSFEDYGESVQQTSDGGYIIAGYTDSDNYGYEDGLLVKTDASGSEQWMQTLGGSYDDRSYSVQQTADGGYIIAGYT